MRQTAIIGFHSPRMKEVTVPSATRRDLKSELSGALEARRQNREEVVAPQALTTRRLEYQFILQSISNDLASAYVVLTGRYPASESS
jgi:hypothetical protein